MLTESRVALGLFDIASRMTLSKRLIGLRVRALVFEDEESSGLISHSQEQCRITAKKG